jgi:hypothetical protein
MRSGLLDSNALVTFPKTDWRVGMVFFLCAASQCFGVFALTRDPSVGRGSTRLDEVDEVT